jgi:hypothetical protein
MNACSASLLLSYYNWPDSALVVAGDPVRRTGAAMVYVPG